MSTVSLSGLEINRREVTTLPANFVPARRTTFPPTVMSCASCPLQCEPGASTEDTACNVRTTKTVPAGMVAAPAKDPLAIAKIAARKNIFTFMLEAWPLAGAFAIGPTSDEMRAFGSTYCSRAGREMIAPPEVTYHAESKLMVWRPRGILSEKNVADIVSFIEWQEANVDAGFNRFTDTTGLDAIDLRFSFVFHVAICR